MKFNIQTVLVTLLLVISLIVRLSHLEYPLIHSSKWGDGTRDYLVAHYIRQFGERPMLGPFNLLFDVGLKNSPLYYYLLAAFLIPKDGVETLGIINILFQVTTIALIYLITKCFFDGRSALFAALLFGFTPTVLRQSEYIWQPYLMQPAALLSIYLLALAHFNKSYKLLLGSLVAMVFAFTIHNSAFPYLLLILLLSLVILKLQNRKLKFYLGAILAFGVILFILHLPVLIYLLLNNSSITGQSDYLSLSNYFNNLTYNFSQISDAFSTSGLLVFGLILIMIMYLIYEKTKRRFFLLGLLFFLTPVLLSSLFNKNQLHYLILSLGIFPILVSVIVTRIFKNIFIYFFVSFLIFYMFSKNFNFLNPKKEHVESKAQILSAASSIQQEVLNIKLKENLQTTHFFQIVSFANRDSRFRYPTLDTIFIVPLEKNLNTKLAKISDDSPFNLIQINDNKYIFVSCFEFNHPNKVLDCSKDFLISFPNYIILKNIYLNYPMSIYLAKRS